MSRREMWGDEMTERVEKAEAEVERLQAGLRKLIAEYRMNLHSSTYADDLEALLKSEAK